MRRAAHLWLLPFILVLLFSGFGCGGGGNDQARGATADDDDVPPIFDDDNSGGDDDAADDDAADDDAADDDAADDDAADDDAADDDAADDDAVDDDAVDDDDDADDDDDDDSDDDDDDDDDATPGEHIQILDPTDGETYTGQQVDVRVYFEGEPTNPSISLDGTPIIGQLLYSGGYYFGTLTGVAYGNHVLLASAVYNSIPESEQISFTTAESEAGWIDVDLSQHYFPAGGSVTVTWTVYNGLGEDVTGGTFVEISTDPTNGVNIFQNTITFNEEGSFQVMANATVDGFPVTGSDFVVVGAAPEVSSVTVNCTPTTLAAGEATTCTGQSFDQYGDPAFIPVTFSVDPPEAAQSIENGVITLILAGAIDVIGTASGTDITGSQTIDVDPGAPSTIEITMSPNPIPIDDTSTAEVTLADQYGNPISAADNVWLTTVPSQGVDISGLEVTPHVGGQIVVTAHALIAGKAEVADSVTLVVTETTPPIIEIYAPERGKFITENPDIMVSGRAYDDVGYIVDLTINGQTATPGAEGFFSAALTLENGVNSIIVWAKDQSGNETTATVSVMYAPSYLPNGQRLSDAMVAKLNQSGLNAIAAIATTMVNELLADSLNGMSWPYVLFEDHVDDPIFGWELLWAKGYINKPTYSPLAISIYPSGPYLHLRATTSQLQTTGSLDYRIIGIPGDMPFTVTATNVQIDANLSISSSGGQIQVTLVDLSIPEPDIDIEINNLFGDLFNWLIDLIVDAFVTGVITDMIEEEIMNIVPGYLEDLMAGLVMSFGFDFFDWSYDILADFDAFETSAEGIAIWLGYSMSYGDGSWTVAPNTPDLPGSLQTLSANPYLGTVIPGTSTPFQFGVAIGDDSLNLMLHVIHRSGLLSLDLDEETLEMFGVSGFNLTTGAMGLFFPGLWAEYGMSAPVVIKLRPKLPPVFNFDIDKDGVPTEIQLGEFQLQMTTNDEVWAQIALAMYIPTTISVDTVEQTISLTFDDIEMYSDLFETLEGIRGNTALFETFLPDLVQALVPMLLNGVLQNFPIPSLEGFTLDIKGLTLTGPSNDWLGIFGDLEQVAAAQQIQMQRLLATRQAPLTAKTK